MKFNHNGKKICKIFVFAFVFMTFVLAQGMCAVPAKVAVIPFAMNSPQDLGFLQKGMFSMLSTRLADPGKVEVLDRETVERSLADARKKTGIKGDLTESRAKTLGSAMGVDYVLYGSLTNFGQSISLDARMVDVHGKKPAMSFFEQSNKMGDVIPMVNKFAGDINLKVFHRSIANELYAGPREQAPQAPGALQYTGGMERYSGGFVNLQSSGGRKGFSTWLTFKGQINGFAAGDIIKDGSNRVVVAEDYKLFIYKYSGNRLVLEKELDYSRVHRIIGVDIADINRNGYPEIFVTSLNIQRDGLRSFVVEFNGSTYVTLTDNEPYYFRVIDSKDQGKILLGQKTASNPFKGPVYTMRASGKRYVTDRKLVLPRNVSVLSLAKGPVSTDKADEFVSINQYGRLTLSESTGAIDWQGNGEYGGTMHYLLLPREDVDASYQERAYFNPRIVFFDTDDDAKPEIFVVKNQQFGSSVMGRYKHFTKGSIDILSWNGIALAPVFKTRSVQGWISDFAIADIDGNGTKELVVSVVSTSQIFTRAKGKRSNIIAYPLK